MKYYLTLAIGTLVTAASLGCGTQSGGSGPAGSFTLAWSEYPSWSVFGVAHEEGLINKEPGQKGKIEEKWGVDIVLQQLEYDPCITAYGNGSADAVCITNMDILAPALSRDSVAILATSTSDGADACIVTGIETVDELAGKETRGLEKSVSQYMFERNLEELGKDPADYPFKQMDPGAAALAMQNKQEESIAVWNPFLMKTLRVREGEAKVLFDSTTIPEEIIDMVVISKDALERPGGQSFACAVIEAFYEVNRLMASSSKGDDTLIALGANFADLGLEDMKQVVQQTKFYKTAQEGIALFEKETFQHETMPKVVDFCVAHGIVPEKPTVVFGGDDAQLRFETRYMKAILQDANSTALAAELLANEGVLEAPEIEVDEVDDASDEEAEE